MMEVYYSIYEDNLFVVQRGLIGSDNSVWTRIELDYEKGLEMYSLDPSYLNNLDKFVFVGKL